MDLSVFKVFGDFVFTNFFEKIGDFVYQFYLVYSRPVLDALHFVFQNLFNVALWFTVIVLTVYVILAIIVQFKKKTKETVVYDNSLLPTVTIQIPTYNELAALNCAQRCIDFDYPKNKVQIIIGDDSSNKSISAKIDAFAEKNDGRILITRRGKNIGFKPGNLNHMLKFTKGDYIVIFDSDFLPGNDFLRRIVSPFINDKNIHAVQARWVIDNFKQNMTSLVGGIIPMFSHRFVLPFLMQSGSNGFIAGSGECVKKSTLLELGGWVSGAFTEDIEYGLRMTRNGKKVVYLEDLPAHCEQPFTIKDLGKQQLRWCYGVILSLKKHLIPILKNKKLPLLWKVNPLLLLFGYVVTFMFFILFSLGLLSLLTHPPGPILWGELLTKTAINFALTSGLLICSIVVLNMSDMKKYIPKMVLASYTVGLVVVIRVTEGVLKALFNRPMHWFMLKKKGNTSKL